MPKLQAKGKNDFVALSTVPSQMAQSEGHIVFAAFRAAADGLLEIVISPDKTSAMEEQALRTFLLLESLLSEMTEDLKRVELVLQVVEGHLTNLGVSDGN